MILKNQKKPEKKKPKYHASEGKMTTAGRTLPTPAYNAGGFRVGFSPTRHPQTALRAIWWLTRSCLTLPQREAVHVSNRIPVVVSYSTSRRIIFYCDVATYQKV